MPPYFACIFTSMKPAALTVIDIKQHTDAITSLYTNFALTQVNDHVIKASVMTQPFYWHLHPNSDESFLVIEGALIIELEDNTIELLPGQFFTIPKNIKHRTSPKGERSVNITFELKDMETVRVE